MGDELRGDSLVHLNVRFSTEAELKQTLDFLYVKSKEGISFTGLIEAMVNEVTIVTAIHNIKSNKGSKTAGVDQMKMDKYLQMPKEELIALIRDNFSNYRPKPAKRVYIPKKNGKKRPLGIPTVLDRIIQECVRIIIEPICEARFYPHSYGFRPYRAQKHAVRDIINVINASTYSKDQPVWAVEGDIKGCFDNIDHRILLQKIWRIGIHDKRVIKIIQQMLKAGYIESGARNDTKLGTMQGGILSPLLSNVYLNDFDWYVGRMYMEPHRKCKHKCNDTRRLKWLGVTPKYNFRFADDWVILTSTEQEAYRLKRVMTKYFRNKMKLELSKLLKKNENIKGIYGCNNTSTVGIAKTLTKQKRTDIVMVGFDMAEETKQFIKDPDYRGVSLMQKQDQMGYLGIGTLNSLINGKKSEQKYFDTGVIMIDSDYLMEKGVS